MSNKQTYHIHLNGLVQGVGFRPLVYRLAQTMQLTGRVCNDNNGLNIELNTDAETARYFFEQVRNAPPATARITQSQITEIPYRPYSSFTIAASEHTGSPQLVITPDIALCTHCRSEIHNKNNRRYRYPFTTCTQCGPRYSVMQELPYDRPFTTMQPFTLCKECNEEYHDVLNRRHYAQTNSCTACGITLSVYDHTGPLPGSDNEQVIQKIVQELTNGKILAVKGIGGFLLLCDAANEQTVNTLRKRKHRPHKPFAVMFTGIEQAKQYVQITPAETAELEGTASPVVIAKALSGNGLPMHEIAPGCATIGVLLPYAPLFEIILHTFGKPVIATSANISGSPIIYTNETAVKELNTIADFIVTHNRDIVSPQDDSVVRYTPVHKRKIILRRARGLAPAYFGSAPATNENFLCTGAQMKSSFALSYHNNIFISQYLGSAETLETQEACEHTIATTLNTLKVAPSCCVTDKHEGYFAYRLGKEMAAGKKIPHITVQHHEAHFAAVLAENNLLEHAEPVLGFIWDGTGLGNNNQVWGSELFLYEPGKMQHVGGFSFFSILLGDKMAREPRLSALSVCKNIAGAIPVLQQLFSETEFKLYHALLLEPQKIFTSSAGRLFDAVAALLELCPVQSFEGQAAMLLETIAAAYIQQNGIPKETYPFRITQPGERADINGLLNSLLNDVVTGKGPGYIAAVFHNTLACFMVETAALFNTKHIACSGGVFQNALLADLLLHHAAYNFHIHLHKELSPNDENISFGQLVMAARNINNCVHLQQEAIPEKEPAYRFSHNIINSF